jgi:hypothetical protein
MSLGPEQFYALSVMCGSVLLGGITAMLGTSNKPVWPLRLCLSLFAGRGGVLRDRYWKNRTEYSRREQFVASVFIWLVVLALGGTFILGPFK